MFCWKDRYSISEYVGIGTGYSTGTSWKRKDSHRIGNRTGNRTLFTVLRYLYKSATGTASCTRTETFIYLDEPYLHSVRRIPTHYFGLAAGFAEMASLLRTLKTNS